MIKEQIKCRRCESMVDLYCRYEKGTDENNNLDAPCNTCKFSANDDTDFPCTVCSAIQKPAGETA